MTCIRAAVGSVSSETTHASARLSSAEPALAERIVVVTGAAGGIGRAVSEHIARLGGRVVAVDRDATAGEAVVEAVGQVGGEACFMQPSATRRRR